MGRTVVGVLAASLVLAACGVVPTSPEATAGSAPVESVTVPVSATTVTTTIIAPEPDAPPYLTAAIVVVSPVTPSTMAARPEPGLTKVAASVAPPAADASPMVPAPTTTSPPPTSTGMATASFPVDAVAADRFASDINQLRVNAGLAALTRSSELDSLAMGWARAMAADGALRHSAIIGSLVAGAWTGAAENIGYGPDETAVFNALAASPGHYTNMTNPLYTDLGTAVVVADNTIWTVHLFAG